VSGPLTGRAALTLRTGPWRAIIAQARRRPTVCAVHRYHWPAPLGLHVHHVWPLGMGGPDVAWNEVAVCPTGHDNIHRIMRALEESAARPAGGRAERLLAMAGLAMWRDAGRPGGHVSGATEETTTGP
jgi:hypothetical protein